MKGKIDRKQIIDGAIVLLEEIGIQDLSMRKLAEQLNVRASSLYWHVKNRSELLELLADRIIQDISIPEAGYPWDVQLQMIATDYRKVLLAYRDSTEILSLTPPATTNRVRLIESIYRIFANAHVSHKLIPSCASLYNNYVLSFVKDEIRLSQTNVNGMKENEEEKNIYFQSKLEEDFPFFIELNKYFHMRDSDEEFQFGLNILLEGFRNKVGKDL
ncbi:TetR/AcrR family transcriptional regulator C-terminal domain-containing protein [Fictibacillus sp. WQ 8-8]|uniref:TetR/AcrR family transcriptional regulator C-terminal domain-containing protein n=1 Tax=Fictibacillus sp. WQ 8-8 TaxID=2938788 RepID=UPI0021087CFB|nr:TetR/AcrR family transcriptional regulator C-terminal domain-containing protein [Fictibacillus sp. WQ 8-8]MCQ6268734.1 TetR/AcrR family transcriptional regulator C-terminal domain-containing protein [Fictibacillus sp. WQ 8-8]